uniref:Uncharacterized protein n=1 Tax=Salix viminalis TaxID=40686 RepID=A0A6N2MP01_SALVM
MVDADQIVDKSGTSENANTETKGSSMIRESNAELFSTRTSLSTARLEVQSASEMLGATENGSLSRKGHEPINIFSLGIEMVRKENQTLELDALEPSCKVGSQENFTANLLVNLNPSCSDAQAVAFDCW